MSKTQQRLRRTATLTLGAMISLVVCIGASAQPDYEGLIDLSGADILVDCTVDVPRCSPEGEGTWTIDIGFSGWAMDVWLQFRSEYDDYCEGFDPHTGDPCEQDWVYRPGWELDNGSYGYDEQTGFWDRWDLELPYHADIWPPDQAASLVPCEAADFFVIEICGQDDYEETYVECIEVEVDGDPNFDPDGCGDDDDDTAGDDDDSAAGDDDDVVGDDDDDVGDDDDATEGGDDDQSDGGEDDEGGCSCGVVNRGVPATGIALGLLLLLLRARVRFA